ncbi:Uncharacterised protein at_DN2240 [Pycnogonum litorale]
MRDSPPQRPEAQNNPKIGSFTLKKFELKFRQGPKARVATFPSQKSAKSIRHIHTHWINKISTQCLKKTTPKFQSCYSTERAANVERMRRYGAMESCFSHGQLHVGCSRVGNGKNLFIFTPNGKTQNAVYPAALQMILNRL